MDAVINIKLSIIGNLLFIIKRIFLFKFQFKEYYFNSRNQPAKLIINGTLWCKSRYILKYKRILNKKICFYEKILFLFKKQIYEINNTILSGELISNKTTKSLSTININMPVTDENTKRIFQNKKIFFRALFQTNEGVIKSKLYKIQYK